MLPLSPPCGQIMWLLLLQSTAHVAWRLVGMMPNEEKPSGQAWTHDQAVGGGGGKEVEEFFSPAMVVARLARRTRPPKSV